MKHAFALLAALFLGMSTAHAGQPLVFWVSDPIKPGETALLFGDGIGADVTATGDRAADDPVAGPPGGNPTQTLVGQKLQVLQASDVSAKVALPSNWTLGMYVLRLKGAGGESQPIYLNRTEAWWWLGGSTNAALGAPCDAAVPGEELRVFGKNLGAKTRAWLAGKAGAVALETIKADKYAATFRVPAGIAPGDYALWLHNGFGGTQGFSSPLKVKVAAPSPWPTTQFNVRDFGAKGDVSAFRSDEAPDDTPAFEAALAKAAANGGGVVFVPRGNYKITGKLLIPPKTILRGEKREWVWLYAPKELTDFDAVIAGNGDFAAEELSITSKTVHRFVACPDVPSIYARARGYAKPEQYGHNVHLHRLMLICMRYEHRGLQASAGNDPRANAANDPIRTEGEGMSAITLAGSDMDISDCDVVSSGGAFSLYGPHRTRISGNRFANGRGGAYLMWDADEMVIENNLFEPHDSEGTGGGFQNHVYRTHFAGNTFRKIFGWDREALSFDSPYTAAFRGTVASVEGASLTARDHNGQAKSFSPGTLKGLACYVAYGKGIGQYSPIADNTATSVTLAKPFAVTPDATSQILFVPTKTENVIADNTYSDASVAVQLYCQCYNTIVDGNRSERTGGMHGYGGGGGFTERKKEFNFRLFCFNQFLNNDLSQGFVYQQGPSMCGMLGVCVDEAVKQPPAIAGIGNVIRNNIARDHNVVGSMSGRAHPFKIPAPSNGADYICRDTIIEGNTVTDTPVALEVYPYHRDTLVRNNHVERSAHPLRDDGANTWIDPAERLAYQREAVRPLIGDASAADLPALWAAVAKARPHGVAPEVVAALVGLRYDVTPIKSLATGKAGKADVEIGVRTEPWSPALSVKCEVQPPTGWRVTNADAADVPPFKIVDFKSNLIVPSNAGIKSLPFSLTVTLGGVPLTVVDQIDVSRRDLTQWMLIGPFANVSGAILDTNIQPAETRLDLAAEYPSLTGPVKWQALASPNKHVDLPKIFNKNEGATALGITCLRVDKATRIELEAACRGGLQIWLNNRQVLSLAPWGSKTIRLELPEGDNLLLCKSSVEEGLWNFALEFKELSLDDSFHVHQLPVAELKTLKALLPPAPKAAKAGTLEHGGNVAWREVLADDFDRRLLGSAWKAVSGDWLLKDNVLAVRGPAFLALNETLPTPMRIEYDVRAESPEDLACFWLRDPTKMTSGAVFSFASGNGGSRLTIEGATEAKSDAPEAKGVPNHWHHVIAQILPDGKVQLFADGHELFTVRGKLKNKGDGHPGLWTWGSSEFSHVRIYTAQAAPEKAR